MVLEAASHLQVVVVDAGLELLLVVRSEAIEPRMVKMSRGQSD
jgi:hypothetical protein